MIDVIDMQKTSPKAHQPVDASELTKLRQHMEMLENRSQAAKVAYLNRTPFDGKEVSYEDLVAIVKEYIRANYAVQRAAFGSVKVRMSVAKLLR
jgi:hypothetical protein